MNRETFCDKCMLNDPNEDYNEPLNYNKEHGDFRCSKGHIEDTWQYFRHDSREYLIETIMGLLAEEDE